MLELSLNQSDTGQLYPLTPAKWRHPGFEQAIQSRLLIQLFSIGRQQKIEIMSTSIFFGFDIQKVDIKYFNAFNF